jgi:rod shape-determining protein MreC
MFWPEGSMPVEGERVVTSAEANAFPSGLPIGVVHYTASNVPEVEPFAQLDRLEVVRIFDYGLTGVQPPESAARVADKRH